MYNVLDHSYPVSSCLSFLSNRHLRLSSLGWGVCPSVHPFRGPISHVVLQLSYGRILDLSYSVLDLGPPCFLWSCLPASEQFPLKAKNSLFSYLWKQLLSPKPTGHITALLTVAS